MKNPNSAKNLARTQTREIVVLAHNIRSTHNIGAILRTSEGFGVAKIIFSGYSPFPTFTGENFSETGRLPHLARKIHTQIGKTALDSHEIVPFELSRDISTTIRKLQAQGFTVFALEQTTDSIQLPDLKLPLNAKVALLLGEEVEGIDEELVKICDQALEIPMFGRKESFNVSVATGIALYKIACE